MNTTTTCACRDFRVPRIFFEDHLDRFCFSDDETGNRIIIVHGARTFTVRLDVAAQINLLGDAVYYGTPDTMDDLPPGLARSAARTVIALRKQGCAE